MALLLLERATTRIGNTIFNSGCIMFPLELILTSPTSKMIFTIYTIVTLSHYVNGEKQEQLDQLNIISNDAYEIIADFFPATSVVQRLQWKEFIKRKQNQLSRLLSRPGCYNETDTSDKFQHFDRPRCSGIEALTFMDEMYRRWIKMFIEPECRGDFSERIIARIMSFISKLYYQVDVTIRCNPRIQLRPRHNDTMDSVESCPNKNKFASVSSMLIRSTLSSLKVFNYIMNIV